MYQITYGKLPKRSLLYLGIAVILIINGFIFPIGKYTGSANYVYFGLIMIESIISILSGPKTNQKGTWLITCGFIAVNFFIIYQILIDYGFTTSPVTGNQVFVYGMLGLAISMSLFLSYNFSYINKNLEKQLENVRLLSENALENEKTTHKLELERKIIEVEHDRKTKELDSARDLQLSLLPKDIPVINNLDIACSMKTATEVGGDYYDFNLSEDNKLTVVIGDATGHGLKAGNMVITAKGLFNVLSDKDDLSEILSVSNNAIKKMNLNMLTMCLAMLRINNNKIEYSSAGMPPLLIFRKRTNEVEQFILKAMPLGAFSDFPYNNLYTTVEKDDIIIMMSDGLTEQFNAEKEVYGMDRLVKSIIEYSGQSAEEIIKYLFNENNEWAGDSQLTDDVTLIVIKVK
jgi:serine phosphatase RsbU (regulator of sigma subunit)